MLRNLKGIYLQWEDYRRALPIMDRLVAMQPEAMHERRDRGMVQYQLGQYREALEDLHWYLDREIPGREAEQARRLAIRIRGMLSE
jgi:regulator of sirC expression with transglutaminase-like and TPR domain